MTTRLWLVMLGDISQQSGIQSIPFLLTQRLAKTAKKDVQKLFQNWSD